MPPKIGAIGSHSYKLGEVITTLKSTASRDAGRSVWQPNYYEHIIRNKRALDKIRYYILNNPLVEYEDINWERLET